MSLDMKLQTNTIQAGLYTVTYGRKEAPLNVQEAVFAAHNLVIVSPAQLGFLRAQGGEGTFNSYSRTNADVLYDNRNNQVVIGPDGAISKIVGIANFFAAHAFLQEYVIPENQRDLVYCMIDEMLKKGTAFTANHGRTDVKTSKFGQTEFTSKLFSDKGLEIKAQDYGDWLEKQKIKIQSIFFDKGDYAKSQKGPYLNRLRVCGPVVDFGVFGNGGLGNFGAFGVHFEKTAEGSLKK